EAVDVVDRDRDHLHLLLWNRKMNDVPYCRNLWPPLGWQLRSLLGVANQPQNLRPLRGDERVLLVGGVVVLSRLAHYEVRRQVAALLEPSNAAESCRPGELTDGLDLRLAPVDGLEDRQSLCGASEFLHDVVDLLVRI